MRNSQLNHVANIEHFLATLLLPMVWRSVSQFGWDRCPKVSNVNSAWFTASILSPPRLLSTLWTWQPVPGFVQKELIWNHGKLSCIPSALYKSLMLCSNFGPTLRAVFRVAPVFRMEITAVCLYRVCNSMPLSDSFRYDTMVILTRLFHFFFFFGFVQFFILITVSDPTRLDYWPLTVQNTTVPEWILHLIIDLYHGAYPIAHLSSRATTLTSHPARFMIRAWTWSAGSDGKPHPHWCRGNKAIIWLIIQLSGTFKCPQWGFSV